MRIVRDPLRTPVSDASVVCIGNFDGVHRGHQALLERGRSLCVDGEELAVVTFDPLPRFYFDQTSAPPRITGAAQRLALLAQQGVDLTWMMRFNARLAALPAAEFVQRVLVNGLNARHIVVGEDFRFGRGREGDVPMLRAFGSQSGFRVNPQPVVEVDGERVSSTRIRHALDAGDLEQAERLLGRDFRLCGRVVRGQQVGRTLDYPTANVRTPDNKCLTRGVFAVYARVRCRSGDGPWLPGVANLGLRPALGGGEPLLEVHLFDFAGNLYGQRLETHLVSKLRDENDFDSLEALKAQMIRDERQARGLLAL